MPPADRLRVPGLDHALATRVAELVAKVRAKVRAMPLEKLPSIAESIDWARALVLLARGTLDAKTADETLGLLVKHEEDRAKVSAELPKLLP